MAAQQIPGDGCIGARDEHVNPDVVEDVKRHEPVVRHPHAMIKRARSVTNRQAQTEHQMAMTFRTIASAS